MIAACSGLSEKVSRCTLASDRRTDALSTLPISRLAIYEAPYIVDDSRPPLAGDYIEHLERLIAEDKRREVFEYFMTEAVGMPEEMVKPMADSPMVDGMLGIAHTIPYDGRVMLRGSMDGMPLPARYCHQVTVPALVMDGGYVIH